MSRIWLLLCLVIPALVACELPVAPAARSTPSVVASPSICGRPSPSANCYTVTTTLLSVKGGPVRACFLTLLSMPPAGCSGVEVRGTDIRHAPGARLFGGGTVTVPTVRLVGVWDGIALTLTEPPVSATRRQATASFPDWVACAADGYADGQANAVKTAIDFDQGIKTYGTFPLDGVACGHNVQVLLAVVQPKSVDYLTARYEQLLAVRGGHLEISGWLQPVAV